MDEYNLSLFFIVKASLLKLMWYRETPFIAPIDFYRTMIKISAICPPYDDEFLLEAIVILGEFLSL